MEDCFKLSTGLRIPRADWDRLRPLTQERVLKYPEHTAHVEKIIQLVEKQLSKDGELFEYVHRKHKPIEALRRRLVHLYIWSAFRKLKAVLYLGYDDLSQAAFLICRQILDEYPDFKRLLSSNIVKDDKILSFCLGVHNKMIKDLSKITGRKGCPPDLVSNLNEDIGRLSEKISTFRRIYDSKDIGDLESTEWKTSPTGRILDAHLTGGEFFISLYRYLSAKSHSSYFIFESKIELPSAPNKLPEFVVEQEVLQETVGFAFEMATKAYVEYLDYIKLREQYDYPYEIVNEIDDLGKKVNMDKLVTLAGRELSEFGLEGFSEWTQKLYLEFRNSS